MTPVRVTLIAGGVGGAKMAEGLSALPEVDLKIIGNIADDAEFHGLWVSPDIDTLTYTLAGLINRDQGWGQADEGRRALDTLARLGEDTWMFLGDRDFGLHIHRTHRLRNGEPRSTIAADVARALGVKPTIILPTDDVVQTRVRTDDGWLDFQTYFVRYKCAPEVREITFRGIDAASPTAAALSAIATADIVVIAPSNPLVSVAPILGIPGIRAAVRQTGAVRIAVSPLIGSKVVKGPADRMMVSLGHRTDAVGVAQLYRDILDVMVIDQADVGLSDAVMRLGMTVAATDILMRDAADKRRLAAQVLDFAKKQTRQGTAA